MPTPSRLAIAMLGAATIAQAQAATPAPHKMRPEHDLLLYGVVETLPAVERVRVPSSVTYKSAGGRELQMDVYLPPGAAKNAPLPAVVFVNGVGDWPGGTKLRQWGQYTSWAKLAAASGMAAVTFDARGEADNAEDVAAAFTYLRDKGASLGIDPSRIALWACSANVRSALAFLSATPPPPLGAAVLYYGAGENVAMRPDLPVLLVRAGRDRPQMNEMLDRLATQAIAANAPWTVINVPSGHHAFDVLDDTDESRVVIRRTLAYLHERLDAPPSKSGPPADARAALAHFFAREWPEAEASYAAYVAAHPDDADAHVLLGNAQVEAQKPDEAAANFRKALAIDPGIGEAWAMLGRIEADKKNYEPAVEALIKALTLMPDDAEATFQLGKIRLARQETDAAVALLEKAVRLAPGNGWAWNSLAYAYLAAKQPAKAASSFERVLPFAPKNPTLLYNTACAYALAGTNAKAIELLDRAVAEGFKDKTGIMNDSDLAGIRSDPRFSEIVKRMD